MLFHTVTIVIRQGLQQCSKLEELSLDNNSIQKIECIIRWPLLHRLSLADNFISDVGDSGLDALARLQYLSLANNRIKSLAGFQQIPTLSELYLSNNLVDTARNVFWLKVGTAVWCCVCYADIIVPRRRRSTSVWI